MRAQRRAPTRARRAGREKSVKPPVVQERREDPPPGIDPTLFPQETAMTAGNPRSIVRSDLIALAAVSFSAGPLLMAAMLYFTKGDWLGWIFAGAAVVM